MLSFSLTTSINIPVSIAIILADKTQGILKGESGVSQDWREDSVSEILCVKCFFGKKNILHTKFLTWDLLYELTDQVEYVASVKRLFNYLLNTQFTGVRNWGRGSEHNDSRRRVRG